MPTVHVRYWAAARAAAGLAGETVEADCVDDAVAALARRHDERFVLVVKASSLLLDGVAVRDPAVRLSGDAELDVLPPFAGG